MRKSFEREVTKLALLSSYTIWNARQEPAWGSEDQPLLAIWSVFLPCHLLALPLWLLHLFLSISNVFWSTLLSYLVGYLIFSCMFFLPCASLGVILRWRLGCGLGLIFPPCIASRFLCLLLEVNKGWHKINNDLESKIDHIDVDSINALFF